MDWTKDQQKVLDARNKNVLVSAAAGSGKTAVLVERIIKLITKEDNPVDIDKILVVTFTNAAAKEMKERVIKSLEKISIESPKNKHIRKQLAYIHNSNISTIHGFCLDVIKDNFQTIDIDPSFSIGEENELNLLKADVLSDILEKKFEEAKEEFVDFVEAFSNDKKDEQLEKYILKVYNQAMSNPYPTDYLLKCKSDYKDYDKWFEELNKYKEYILSEVISQINYAISLFEEENLLKYNDIFESEKKVFQIIKDSKNYDECRNILNNFSFQRIPTISKKDGEVNNSIKDFVQGIRNNYKKVFSRLKDNFYAFSYQEQIEDIEKSYPNISVLVDITKEFIELYKEEKKQRKIIDFNDMEHFALKILLEKDESGNLKPTDKAKELSDRFYEIMIDEYQDSNFVQDAILSAVSKMHKNEFNIFMVGDIKQSIYKFRLARPDLFLNKYINYSFDEEAKKQKINLSMNFRSRKEILHGVNYIFRQIMNKNLGDIDYDDEAALYYGAEYQENSSDLSIELNLLDEETIKETEISNKEFEAYYIARKISDMIKNKYQVTDKKTRKLRDATYKDFVILLRSVKDTAEVYTDILMSQGIPVSYEASKGFFNTKEIVTIVNLLKIIDNPYQDIAFAGTIKLPFVNINQEELSLIRAELKNITLYEAFVSYLELNKKDSLSKKVKEFLDRLDSYREFAKYNTLIDIIDFVIDDTNIYRYFEAMKNGKQKVANINLLKQKAKTYQKSSYHGLFNFIRLISKMKVNEVDYGEASIFTDADDSVRIQTMHKSKGQEFPIVFLGNLSKQFNIMDNKSQVVINSDLGIGIDHFDKSYRTKNDLLIKQLIKEKNVVDLKAEELRILYVAMTRAKEKLIMVSSTKTNSFLKTLNSTKYFKELVLPSLIVYDGGSYLDWIACALSRNQALDEIYNNFEEDNNTMFYSIKDENPKFKVDIIDFSSVIYEEVEKEVDDNNKLKNLLNQKKDDKAFKEESAIIQKNINFLYEYRYINQIHSKYSVTEIKKLSINDEDLDYSEKLYNYTEEIAEITYPEFIQKVNTNKGALRGSAYHRIYELIDYNKELNEEYLDLIIPSEYKEVIDKKTILNFRNTKIYERMKNAHKNNSLFREAPFVIGVSASEIAKLEKLEDLSDIKLEYLDEEIVLVQGIIDAYIIEDDKVTIIDYKTDNVSSDVQLKELYKSQLDYYARAIEQITDLKVKEKIIYSVKFNSEVKV